MIPLGKECLWKPEKFDVNVQFSLTKIKMSTDQLSNSRAVSF